MVTVSTSGLRGDGTAADELPPIPWAVAAGTANAIEVDYDGEVLGLTDGLILGFRAAAANTIAAPTFSPDSFTPHTIVREGGAALKSGDISSAGAEYLVRYNLANTRWELLNPSRDSGNGHVQWIAADGAVDVITAAYSPAIISLTDGLILGFRSLGANTTTTPTFSPNGLTAYTIVKAGGVALVAGDIGAVGAEHLVRYNLANTRWELLNPKYPAVAADVWSFANAANGELFKILASGVAGADSNSAQPWFPSAGAVTVASDKSYMFEGFLHLVRSAGSTSHTTGILFGGTATLTGIRYLAMCKEGDANDLQDISGFVGAAATELVVKAASTSTTENAIIRVTGVVRINAGGTFIPQFKYSAAPGGAPTVQTNSFFRMVPLGSGSVTEKGTWA